MRGKSLSWLIAALAVTSLVVGGCKKPPNPFEPIAAGDEAPAPVATAPHGGTEAAVTEATDPPAADEVERSR